ncbi:hypothetical protein M6D93_18505 [Jatrophihabitans telluris]|uniref:Uncharacterized protein n=1 Tax=Jatrophihabitans telluris TaxID=2038343 RepID=A0ABY4QX42_9ACTN|nr:hypothetical protein [Jatrophihabitans telluris]UQX88256.1 hypothetical protein M6D93_18505 [Jatrophihabitans telluris]
MAQSFLPDHLTGLLAPLFDAGWQALPRTQQPLLGAGSVAMLVVLQRSCMVLGVEYGAGDGFDETLRFVPALSLLDQPEDGIGLFDMVTKASEPIASSHGLIPVVVRDVAAPLGLLDPTRIRLAADTDPAAAKGFMNRLYHGYVGRVAARFRGGPTITALKALDADEAYGSVVQRVAHDAPGVMPDPVLMAATHGIVLHCWRNTALEDVHAGGQIISQVAMAKLNIVTTKAVRPYLTTKGVDWNGVCAVLLDPERSIGRDDGASVGELLGEDWPLVQNSVASSLADWQHIERVAGPEATLRLLSVAGSSAFTERWWGTGWWPRFADQVYDHVRHAFPDSLPPAPDSDTDGIYRLELQQLLRDEPETLPDDALEALLYPPDQQGLAHAELPEIPVQVMQPQLVDWQQAASRAA